MDQSAPPCLSVIGDGPNYRENSCYGVVSIYVRDAFTGVEVNRNLSFSC